MTFSCYKTPPLYIAVRECQTSSFALVEEPAYNFVMLITQECAEFPVHAQTCLSTEPGHTGAGTSTLAIAACKITTVNAIYKHNASTVIICAGEYIIETAIMKVAFGSLNQM